ncbi:paraquat-inducible protein A [Pseudomonas bharatica]|uniref:paraquat-inducible protein A n=1 Tax=Pseudomonas bharatica TaxID=2692112 RepID=UPI003B28187F
MNARRASDIGLALCHVCEQACHQQISHCPRCDSPVHVRKPKSLSRTWALLIASLICYLPANLLPVMRTNMLGSVEANTIMSGVIEFWHSGSWDIAVLIFIASVVVPCGKFLGLSLLLVTCQNNCAWKRKERARLYRFIEVIGYWSMLDVIVVALVAALVQFRGLSTIEPLPGIVFFGLVVVLTMFAAMSFDPRLIWDAEEIHA